MAIFFNLPKPKRYYIEPRFWDPEKEKREARDRRIKAELGYTSADSEYKPFIGKGDIRRGISKGKWGHNNQRRNSNTRVLVLAVLIGLLLYFILS